MLAWSLSIFAPLIFFKMIYITRRERFNAAHKLFREEWSDEKNLETFGKCSNPNWHGHNYELFVTVKGNINPDTGFVIDLKELKKIIRTQVTDALDHKNINLDVNFMKGKMASTEVLAVAIFDQLKTHVEEQGAKLHGIKLYETENNFVEYLGE
ncbi:MAG: 6-pyruvoyl-tetrahydropterin synthase [Daejeonella sp.]|nr:6-pyruvoyl-tetrahydropterin synthase [Daejeonella sp.]